MATYKIVIAADGAKEIRVRQQNNGGDAFLGSKLGKRYTVRTITPQKGKPVTTPIKLQIKIFWQTAYGGGEETHIEYVNGDTTFAYIPPSEVAAIQQSENVEAAEQAIVVQAQLAEIEAAKEAEIMARPDWTTWLGVGGVVVLAGTGLWLWVNRAR